MSNFIIVKIPTVSSEPYWNKLISDELNKGHARYGFSDFEGANLNELQTMVRRVKWTQLNPLQRVCWSNAAFLLDVRQGDYFVYTDLPTTGFITVVTITGDYKFSPVWDPEKTGNYRHLFSCKQIGILCTTDPLIPSKLAKKISRPTLWRKMVANSELLAFTSKLKSSYTEPVDSNDEYIFSIGNDQTETRRDRFADEAPGSDRKVIPTDSPTSTERHAQIAASDVLAVKKSGYNSAIADVVSALNGNSALMDKLLRRFSGLQSLRSCMSSRLVGVVERPKIRAGEVFEELRLISTTQDIGGLSPTVDFPLNFNELSSASKTKADDMDSKDFDGTFRSPLHISDQSLKSALRSELNPQLPLNAKFATSSGDTQQVSVHVSGSAGVDKKQSSEHVNLERSTGPSEKIIPAFQFGAEQEAVFRTQDTYSEDLNCLEGLDEQIPIPPQNLPDSPAPELDSSEIASPGEKGRLDVDSELTPRSSADDNNPELIKIWHEDLISSELKAEKGDTLKIKIGSFVKRNLGRIRTEQDANIDNNDPTNPESNSIPGQDLNHDLEGSANNVHGKAAKAFQAEEFGDNKSAVSTDVGAPTVVVDIGSDTIVDLEEQALHDRVMEPDEEPKPYVPNYYYDEEGIKHPKIAYADPKSVAAGDSGHDKVEIDMTGVQLVKPASSHVYDTDSREYEIETVDFSQGTESDNESAEKLGVNTDIGDELEVADLINSVPDSSFDIEWGTHGIAESHADNEEPDFVTADIEELIPISTEEFFEKDDGDLIAEIPDLTETLIETMVDEDEMSVVASEELELEKDLLDNTISVFDVRLVEEGEDTGLEDDLLNTTDGTPLSNLLDQNISTNDDETVEIDYDDDRIDETRENGSEVAFSSEDAEHGNTKKLEYNAEMLLELAEDDSALEDIPVNKSSDHSVGSPTPGEHSEMRQESESLESSESPDRLLDDDKAAGPPVELESEPTSDLPTSNEVDERTERKAQPLLNSETDSTEAFERLRSTPRNYLMVKMPIRDVNSGSTGYLRDLTEKGAQIAGMECKKGEIKKLLIEAEELSDVEPFTFDGECRWTADEDEEGVSAGFRIIKIEKRDLAQLKKLIGFLSLGSDLFSVGDSGAKRGW